MIILLVCILFLSQEYFDNEILYQHSNKDQYYLYCGQNLSECPPPIPDVSCVCLPKQSFWNLFSGDS